MKVLIVLSAIVASALAGNVVTYANHGAPLLSAYAAPALVRAVPPAAVDVANIVGPITISQQAALAPAAPLAVAHAAPLAAAAYAAPAAYAAAPAIRTTQILGALPGRLALAAPAIAAPAIAAPARLALPAPAVAARIALPAGHPLPVADTPEVAAARAAHLAAHAEAKLRSGRRKRGAALIRAVPPAVADVANIVGPITVSQQAAVVGAVPAPVAYAAAPAPLALAAPATSVIASGPARIAYSAPAIAAAHAPIAYSAPSVIAAGPAPLGYVHGPALAAPLLNSGLLTTVLKK